MDKKLIEVLKILKDIKNNDIKDDKLKQIDIDFIYSLVYDLIVKKG